MCGTLLMREGGDDHIIANCTINTVSVKKTFVF